MNKLGRGQYECIVTLNDCPQMYRYCIGWEGHSALIRNNTKICADEFLVFYHPFLTGKAIQGHCRFAHNLGQLTKGSLLPFEGGKVTQCHATAGSKDSYKAPHH